MDADDNAKREADRLSTCKQAYELLQGLYVRSEARIPNHVHMAMCYLQIEVTQSTKPQHYVATPSSAAMP